MAEFRDNWLSTLKGPIPQKALGNKMSMYAIALEGWRRGLILKFRHTFNEKEGRVKVVYSLSYKGKKHNFAVSRGDLVSKEAINICIDKDKTKSYLLKENVPAPYGKGFTADTKDEAIINYAESIGYPLVIKPIDGLSGRGVMVNLKNKGELEKALKHVRYQLNYKEVVVEKFVTGEDSRVYVIGDKVVGAVTRIAANVIGNGKDTIQELIDKKNIERNNNPNHYKRPIKIDNKVKEYLGTYDLDLDSIPKDGERVYLKKTSNVSDGGEPIDITDILTDEMKEVAVNAMKAIPGLVHCAVDMLVDNEKNTASVIEINSKPQIGAHLFPVEGKARNIPKEIIDYYFPETKDLKTNTSYFFDFDAYLDPLLTGAAKEVTVKKVPEKQTVTKKFEVNGPARGSGYLTFIKKSALRNRLNGYVKRVGKSKVSIVVAGKRKNIETFAEFIKDNKPPKAEIKELKEKSWNEPVKLGFEVAQSKKKVSARKLRSQIAEMNETLEDYKYELMEIKEENKKLKHKNGELESSKSFRYTAPFRKVSSKIMKNRTED
ncbi:acylphosphatase [Alkalibacillus haloalkaliphilus]|uniref:acylphosphatase n=1 Tax=Alkalibacillus haloalkaliphilus TaxID=94136 RepID=UPI0002D6C107|nr:acylphosphatase [Alkalibacillus haloalkaliphilus]